jgi:hypothetical protein
MHHVDTSGPGRSRVPKGGHRLRRSSTSLSVALVAGSAFSTVMVTPASAGPTPSSLCGGYTLAQFGPNVCVFTAPSGANAASELAAIQTAVNDVATQQVPVSAQFDNDGYALLFEPGTYGTATDPLVFQVGYYTEVAGLGAVPQDTVINGQIDAFPNTLDSEPGPGNCYVAAGQTCYWANSTDNFWRSLSNLDLNVMTDGTPVYTPPPLPTLPPISDTGADGCWGGSTDFWSVSQAAPVRSVIINGNLNFQSYCSETNYQSNNYGSGSYVANSEIDGQLDWSGNQQGIARNSDFQSAAGYVWNYVYSGDACPPGYAPPAGTACSPTQDAFDGTSKITNGTDGINGIDQVTELPQSPVTEEEPFIYSSAGANGNAQDSVFLPAVQRNSSGPNFLSGTETGSSIPLTRFFIANPSTPVTAINVALALGRDLILTPGVYTLGSPIVVSRPDTVVLGLGFATLVPQRGNAAMIVVPNNGVKVSGIIIDAGPVNSPVLLSVGTPGFGRGGFFDNPNDPDLIQDTFIRVGGVETTPVSATVSLVDNADNSIIDDVWIWRADHGANTSVTGPDGQVGAGWTFNRGDTGLLVTGDNVTAYGLAVEHFQKNEVIWSGQNGATIFFQNELPYDPPSQTAWMATPTQDGYPAFLVTPNVKTFQGYGMGSYVVFIYTSATLNDSEAYEAPQTPGVQFNDVFDLFISSTCTTTTPPSCGSAGSGGFSSVINGTGGSATSVNPTTPVDITSSS